ncbi:npr-11 [Pristionchus pacificus]|uniref:Npr-11 n=1 Tax=Pristionchus pacificus TaxID=54126 RepID=A0A2A6D345_PRIPA|nr:npr-11 [Pristionchus pacificus]|eukprot:PDM84819.1 npr-11 [Pristionchus pacificus]
MSLNNSSCETFRDAFTKINLYFRDDAVLNGTEYSSSEWGYAITTAYVFIIFFGAFGNALTITVVILNPAMRTTRNFFILNLALSDFFVCTVTAPMTLYTVRYIFWPFGTVLCKVAGSLQAFNVFLSTFSIAAIALDRYVLVIFPTKRAEQRTLSLIFFIVIWVVSLILALPLLIASDLNILFHDQNCGITIQICQEQNEIWQGMVLSKQAYTLSVLITQYAFPLFSIVFAYSSIAHRMKMRLVNRGPSIMNSTNRQRRQSVVERQRRTHLLLLSVVVLFAVAWFPLNVFHVFNTFDWVDSFSVPVFASCHVVAMCSACLNPLIYAFFNQNFRTEFFILFEKIGLKFNWLTKKKKKSPRNHDNSVRRNDLTEQIPVLNTAVTATGNTEIHAI